MTEHKNAPVYIMITGGVISSLGKGIVAASLAALIQAHNPTYRIANIKVDPYLNINSGTMNPYQHGEVYVTDDGAETDLDLGHYERFTGQTTSARNSITAGRIYSSLLQKEREGKFLGQCIQVVPHVVNEIKEQITCAWNDLKEEERPNVIIVEIGGTVGDIEGLPFLEAARQIGRKERAMFIHVSYVPYVATAGEPKSKPTQHSVQKLQSLGIQPDMIVCRYDGYHWMNDDFYEKIAMFAGLDRADVIGMPDLSTIYDAPITLERTGIIPIVFRKLGLTNNGDVSTGLNKWDSLTYDDEHVRPRLRVVMCGKYIKLADAYKSVNEAIKHAAHAVDVDVTIEYIDAETWKDDSNHAKNRIDALIIPGGFGQRGFEGMICAAKWARESKTPFLGICFGMQVAVVEYVRYCGAASATSAEIAPESSDLAISAGPCMRLGARNIELKENSLISHAYDSKDVRERHRHRYEISDRYAEWLETDDGIIMRATGWSTEMRDGNPYAIVEAVEINALVHPYYVGVQFHPEFKSGPWKPHPLFIGLLQAARDRSKNE